MNKIVRAIYQQKINSSKTFCAYYYDLQVLRTHLNQVMNSLPANCQMFYAMKANSETQILKVVGEYVHGFEVASIGEIKKARKILTEIPLIFGGPGKTDTEIRGAIALNIKWFHVESIQELRRIELIAANLDRVITILLRVNLSGNFPAATLQMAGRPTQFGISEVDVSTAINVAVSSQHLKLEGFHFHSISNNLDPQTHLQLIEYYFERIKTWSETHGLSVLTLNAGGGIGINYADLNKHFNWSSFSTQLANTLASSNSDRANVLFECGRFITASCGFYAVEVLDIKKNHDRNFIVVSGGTQHFRLPVSWNHNHPFEVVPIETWRYPFERLEILNSEVTIVGQLCTPKDVFAKNVFIKKLRIGDIILFLYTGAYGWSISHHDFLSHPHPDRFYLE